MSKVYFLCVNAINCTGKNMSDDLLFALGEADSNMYACSEEIRPSENWFYLLIWLTSCDNFGVCAICTQQLDKSYIAVTMPKQTDYWTRSAVSRPSIAYDNVGRTKPTMPYPTLRGISDWDLAATCVHSIHYYHLWRPLCLLTARGHDFDGRVIRCRIHSLNYTVRAVSPCFAAAIVIRLRQHLSLWAECYKWHYYNRGRHRPSAHQLNGNAAHLSVSADMLMRHRRTCAMIS